jgi:hypothetical protein
MSKGFSYGITEYILCTYKTVCSGRTHKHTHKIDQHPLAPPASLLILPRIGLSLSTA